MTKMKSYIKKIGHAGACSALAAASAFGQTGKLASPERGFVSVEKARSWEQGLLSGNGTIGVSVLSDPLDETLVFSHERLFLPQNTPHKPPFNGDRLFEIRELISKGLYEQAAALSFDMSEQDDIIMPDPPVPAFDLTIKTHGDPTVKNYSRSVNFETGETTVRWQGKKGWYERRMFVSRADGFAVLKLINPSDSETSYSISMRSVVPSQDLNERQLDDSKESFNKYVSSDNVSVNGYAIQYSNKFTKAFPGGVHGVQGIAYVNRSSGSVSPEEKGLLIKEAQEVVIYIKLEPIYNFNDSLFSKMETKLAAVQEDYSTLLNKHAAIHGEIFKRAKIELGGGEDHLRPIEELIAESKSGTTNRALLEKLFDAGRYNIMSSTGELPPPLQGIWTGTYAPWWNGGYTHNGNVPAAIAANLTTNMPEMLLPYFSYIESMVPYFEINAKNQMGCRGILMPSHTTSHGFNTLIHRTRFPGAFWVSGAPWASRFFYDYYLYTGDKEFLKNHALPFMEKAALFFEDYLYMGPDGKYVFSPGQSPENSPLNLNTQASFNATMDVATCSELLRNIISASKTLKVNQDKIPVWEKMLTRMPDYMISKDGIIKEWLTPLLEDRLDHRHLSQLYALYFEADDEFDRRPELQEAAKKLIQYKLDWRDERDTSGGNMAFGIVQLGQAASSLGDSALAHRCLSMLANRYWNNNLASTHNYGDRFNMDISGGLPNLITKMLVESRPGRIKLLPALPSEWVEGKADGLLCSGQVEVNELSWNENSVYCKLTSQIAQRVVLQFPKVVASKALREGSSNIRPVAGNPRQIEVDLPADTTIAIEISF